MSQDGFHYIEKTIVFAPECKFRIYSKTNEKNHPLNYINLMHL